MMRLNHIVIHVDRSAALDFDYGSDEAGFRSFIAQEIALLVEQLGRPDANWYLPLQLAGDDTQLLAVALAKPRMYRQATETIGWAIALISPTEYAEIEGLPEDERDNRLMTFLGLEGEQAAYWTKRY